MAINETSVKILLITHEATGMNTASHPSHVSAFDCNHVVHDLLTAVKYMRSKSIAHRNITMDNIICSIGVSGDGLGMPTTTLVGIGNNGVLENSENFYI